jgi:polyphosphate kinase
MFPVLQDDIRKKVFEILSAYFQDNCQAWILDSEGNWNRLCPVQGEKNFRVQAHFHSRAAQAQEHPGPARREFIVRRSPPSKNIE